MDFDEVVQSSKKRDNYNYLFCIQNRRFEGLFPPSSGFWKVSEANPRGCHIEFPSPTFQNSEEWGNKPSKRQFWIQKKIFIITSLFWSLDYLIKIHSIHLSVRLQKLHQSYKIKLVKFEILFHFKYPKWRKLLNLRIPNWNNRKSQLYFRKSQLYFRNS